LPARPGHRLAQAEARQGRSRSRRRFGRVEGSSMRNILALATIVFPLAALAQEQPPLRAPREAPEQGVQIAPPLTLAESPEAEVPDHGAPVLTLEEVIAAAERPQGNLDLVQLREQLEQANNAVQRAWSALLPQVTAAATYTRNQHQAVIPFPNFAAGFVEGPDGGFVPAEILELEVQKQDQFTA